MVNWIKRNKILSVLIFFCILIPLIFLHGFYYLKEIKDLHERIDANLQSTTGQVVEIENFGTKGVYLKYKFRVKGEEFENRIKIWRNYSNFKRHWRRGHLDKGDPVQVEYNDTEPSDSRVLINGVYYPSNNPDDYWSWRFFF